MPNTPSATQPAPVVAGPSRPHEPHAKDADERMDESPADAADPGMVRAGAAAAARRRELDISQRSLAADGIINAGALIAFEKGRSWPRERTRAKLEEVLQWPVGEIARIRRGESSAGEATGWAPPADATMSDISTPEGSALLVAQAVAAAVDGCRLAIDALPPVGDSDFGHRLVSILADLRRLEAIAVQGTHLSRITPEFIKSLGAVRRYHEELMLLGATAPDAPLGQRLYAARRRANLSAEETAQAAGVAEDLIVRVEADEAVPVTAVNAIEALISQIS
jgi:transcriptional regulator with XRE-family HTH domain